MQSSIDWTQPWYDSVRDTAQAVSSDELSRAALNRVCSTKGLTNHRDLPLSFVEQATLPKELTYETFISISGCVPTRNNLHDFFNALVWLSFPRIKKQLNALQAANIASSGIGARRGALRDAATIFDENSALLVVDHSARAKTIVEDLRAHNWVSALLEQRTFFEQNAQVWLFGHALMEKLITPYKAITAHVWVASVNDGFFLLPHTQQRDFLDMQIAAELAADEFTTACFTPLPVLGVPGWWHPQDLEFYQDSQVFRSKNRHQKKG